MKLKNYFKLSYFFEVPDEAQSLLALINRVNKEHPNEIPILVHCRFIKYKDFKKIFDNII